MFSKKVYSVLLLSALALSATTYTYAQAKKKIKKESGITLGFQGGRELLFNSSPLIHSRQSKVHYGISKSFVLRKSISTHFKAEARFSDVTYPGMLNVNSFSKNENRSVTNRFSVPLSLQYHPLCCGVKIDPYCGMGMQYNLNPSSAYLPSAEVPIQKANSGTKYINILFTQGVTYEINTKINIDESMHFIPGSGSKTLGFDVGIGYKLR